MLCIVGNSYKSMQAVITAVIAVLLTVPFSRCSLHYNSMVAAGDYTSSTSQEMGEESSSSSLSRSHIMPLWWTYVRERKNNLSNMMRIGRRRRTINNTRAPIYV
ncbi:hypothetical protein Tcan_05623 [Toxocara canis]|uniref:Uncharacterized protein n=1 Tax=Toxocara canis TaxID=6265 RepID=A0A0B2VSD6_TOXCA|nr:hypothetical protein Tcan_05623 [Toxocara canis]